MNRLLQLSCGEGIFSANIDVALCRADRECRYGHAFENGERVPFHQDAVLEGAGLGLVRVANHVVRAVQIALGVNGLPFFPGRESRTAAAKQFRIDNLANNALRTEVQGFLQRLVTAQAAVIIDARRIRLT